MNSHSTNIPPRNELLIELMKLYVETVLSFSSTLSGLLQLSDLTTWRSKGVSIKDSFDEGWSYAFHGSGCCIFSPGLEVDFEFNSDCQVGGFDVWRLWSFVCDNDEVSSKFSKFTDKMVIEEAFNELLNNRLIEEDAGLYRLVL